MEYHECYFWYDQGTRGIYAQYAAEAFDAQAGIMQVGYLDGNCEVVINAKHGN